MAVGNQPSLADVNAQLSSVASALHSTLIHAHELHTWYVALGPGGLTNLPYSMSAADDATAGSALADAEQLYQIFIGTQSLATVKDFTAFLQRLWGFGF